MKLFCEHEYVKYVSSKPFCKRLFLVYLEIDAAFSLSHCLQLDGMYLVQRCTLYGNANHTGIRYEDDVLFRWHVDWSQRRYVPENN